MCADCAPPPHADSFALPSGLLGPLFSDSRLYEGEAFAPWQYVFNVGVAGSQFANTLLLGDPDESLSSRIGRSQYEGNMACRYVLGPAADLLIGPDHCRVAVEWAEERDKELWSW